VKNSPHLPAYEFYMPAFRKTVCSIFIGR